LVLLSLIPQIQLWLVRGRDWNGAYVSPQGDEPLYSAYINALIDGRTRKNDPFGAKDSSAKAPLPESTFSIQLVPAYAIALPARAFGFSSSTAFIVLSSVAALLGVYLFSGYSTALKANNRLAAAGTFFVLCLWRFAGSYGVFGTLIDVAIPALPFLRRYQPRRRSRCSLSFSYWCGMRFLASANAARESVHPLPASLCMLIFSYPTMDSRGSMADVHRCALVIFDLSTGGRP